MSITSRTQKDTNELDRTFLGLANDAYQESKDNRVKFAQIAREAGLTNQEIADAYGITEGAVRQMLKRASK
jgi:DNA-binding transcriptional regulator LsrR (DeoR family)